MMSGGLYANHLKTCVWIARNENELTRAERLKAYEIIEGEPTEAERRELVAIRRKYDKPFNLQCEMAATNQKIDAILDKQHRTKALQPAAYEDLRDERKVMETLCNLKSENEELKIKIARLKDELHWSNVEKASAWQASERATNTWLNRAFK